jgi:hypothetical protein
MPNEQGTPSGSGPDAWELTGLVQQASNDLDEACIQRHIKGQEKYGTFTYFDNDTIAMAMEEIADMMNYMRYTWIKLWLMQRAIAKKAQEHSASDSGGWIPLKDL